MVDEVVQHNTGGGGVDDSDQAAWVNEEHRGGPRPYLVEMAPDDEKLFRSKAIPASAGGVGGRGAGGRHCSERPFAALVR